MVSFPIVIPQEISTCLSSSTICMDLLGFVCGHPNVLLSSSSRLHGHRVSLTGWRVDGALSISPRTPAGARMVAAPEKGSKGASASAGAAAGQEKGQLTPRAIEMLSWLRAHKSILDTEAGFNSTQTVLCKKNDTARCMIPAMELDTNAAELPGVDAARVMLEHKDEIIEKAKRDVLDAIPALADDTPTSRMVWHDVALILRIISYAAAVSVTTFLHENNVGIMRDLYREVGLSNTVVKTMISSMKGSALALLSDASLKDSTAACFNVFEAEFCE